MNQHKNIELQTELYLPEEAERTTLHYFSIHRIGLLWNVHVVVQVHRCGGRGQGA